MGQTSEYIVIQTIFFEAHVIMWSPRVRSRSITFHHSPPRWWHGSYYFPPLKSYIHSIILDPDMHMHFFKCFASLLFTDISLSKLHKALKENLLSLWAITLNWWNIQNQRIISLEEIPLYWNLTGLCQITGLTQLGHAGCDFHVTLKLVTSLVCIIIIWLY